MILFLVLGLNKHFCLFSIRIHYSVFKVQIELLRSSLREFFEFSVWWMIPPSPLG